MKVENFIIKASELLNLNITKITSKKKSLKNILKKLHLREGEIEIRLQKRLKNTKKENLTKELELINLYKTKGDTLLHELIAKKKEI